MASQGWGSMSYLAVSSEDVQSSEDILNAPRKLFGQLRATSIAGNGVSGGVFYTFPAVITVAGDCCFISLREISCL